MSFLTTPLRKNWLITQKPLFRMLAEMPAGGTPRTSRGLGAARSVGGPAAGGARTSVQDGGAERERHAVLLRILPVVGRLQEAHICADGGQGVTTCVRWRGVLAGLACLQCHISGPRRSFPTKHTRRQVGVCVCVELELATAARRTRARTRSDSTIALGRSVL